MERNRAWPPPANSMISFTGTREEPSLQQAAGITTILNDLHEAAGFVTGACIGIDHRVGRYLVDRFPDKRHVVIVPADRSRVCSWWTDRWLQQAVKSGLLSLHVHEMRPGTTHRDRNLALVVASLALIGFPKYRKQNPASRRSGSWQTIEFARERHSWPPAVLPLDVMARWQQHPLHDRSK